MRHRFDVHAAFGGDHHSDPARSAVDEHGEVIFLLDVDAVGDVEAVHFLAFIAGLHGDEGVAEHVLGVRAHIVDRLGQPHAALGAFFQLLERALAAAAGVDLRLHDIERSGQLFGAFYRFLDGHGRIAGGDADAVFGEKLFGLIFVNVHGEMSLDRFVGIDCVRLKHSRAGKARG